MHAVGGRALRRHAGSRQRTRRREEVGPRLYQLHQAAQRELGALFIRSRARLTTFLLAQMVPGLTRGKRDMYLKVRCVELFAFGRSLTDDIAHRTRATASSSAAVRCISRCVRSHPYSSTSCGDDCIRPLAHAGRLVRYAVLQPRPFLQTDLARSPAGSLSLPRLVSRKTSTCTNASTRSSNPTSSSSSSAPSIANGLVSSSRLRGVARRSSRSLTSRVA